MNTNNVIISNFLKVSALGKVNYDTMRRRDYG